MATDSTAADPPAAASEATARLFLDGLRASIARQRRLAERALEQVDDEELFAALEADGNSLAILVKHVGGNLLSRFTDFLTSDGEKPDRHRDQEFVIGHGDDRASLMQRWGAGWKSLEAAVAGLGPEQLRATVTIRSEPYGVIEALLRAHDHVAYHVGQIVQLARLRRGAAWRTLSIPRGGSAAFLDAVRRGETSQRTVGAAETDEAS